MTKGTARFAMNIIQGDMHDPLCATYQTLELARLNDVLKQAGVEDQSLRRQICEMYFFDSGYFLDACWFEEESRRFRPGIHFVEINEQSQEAGNVFLPDPNIGTMFHEYTHGCSAWLFEEHDEDASEIQTGDTLA
jgi:hypothetical protein